MYGFTRVPVNYYSDEHGRKYLKSKSEIKNKIENKQRLKNSLEYYEAQTAYFATNKPTINYRNRIQSSLDRYNSKKRDNLYAIAMPGCHGKSYYCEKYGFIDVDNLLSVEEHNKLTDIRREMVRNKQFEWVEHNKLWWSKMNQVLDNLPLNDTPTLIMVHNEETALEIGAEFICTIVLNEKQFQDNLKMSRRDDLGKMFAKMNRQTVMNKDCLEVIYKDTNEQVERLIINTCNTMAIPIGNPAKYSYKVFNPWYNYNIVPNWILEGDTKNIDYNTLFDLYDREEIPKECVDFFVKQDYNRTNVRVIKGFGVTTNDWVKVISEMTLCVNQPKNFKLSDDFAETFPFDSAIEKNRVNLTLRRLDNEYNFMSDKTIYDILTYHVGERHNFVTGLISHFLGIGKTIKDFDISYMYKVKEISWGRVLKQFHNLIRLSRSFINFDISEEDRQKLMYMDILLGKKLYTMDWRAVLDERNGKGKFITNVSYNEESQTWTSDQYKIDFESALDQAYGFWKPKTNNIHKNFLEFWQRRREWSTKGSLVYNKLPDKYKNIILTIGNGIEQSLIKRRNNKMSLLEVADLESIFKENVDEFNTTKIAVKLESGKERALLPGGLTHFILFTYVLTAAEKCEQVGSSRLNAKDDESVEYYEAKMLSGAVHMLYDWANFNAQHSAYEMKRVIEKLGDKFTFVEDYYLYARCIADSMMNMYLETDEGKQRIERGLYSGWRGTSWINTTMNYIYTNIGLKCYYRLYGEDPIIAIDHGGDDIDMMMKRYNCAIRMMRVMERIGHEAQVIKQMIDTKSEFFRIAILTDRVLGNPTRALVNFVNGNWEGMGPTTLNERIEGILQSIAKLNRRGVSDEFCETLVKASTLHWCRTIDEDEWMPIPPHVKHAMREQNGLGIPDENGEIWELDKDIPMKDVVDEVQKLPGAKASTDYVEELVKELATKELQLTRTDEIIKRLAADSFEVSRNISEYDWKAIKNDKYIVVMRHKIYQDIIDINEANKFYEWMRTGPLVEELASREDLLQLLKYIKVDGNEANIRNIINEIIGIDVSMDILKYQGDRYYRWLVPEFVSTMIEKYVKEKMYLEGIPIKYADYLFKSICSTIAKFTKDRM